MTGGVVTLVESGVARPRVAAVGGGGGPVVTRRGCFSPLVEGERQGGHGSRLEGEDCCHHCLLLLPHGGAQWGRGQDMT